MGTYILYYILPRSFISFSEKLLDHKGPKLHSRLVCRVRYKNPKKIDMYNVMFYNYIRNSNSNKGEPRDFIRKSPGQLPAVCIVHATRRGTACTAHAQPVWVHRVPAHAGQEELADKSVASCARAVRTCGDISGGR